MNISGTRHQNLVNQILILLHAGTDIFEKLAVINFAGLFPRLSPPFSSITLSRKLESERVNCKIKVAAAASQIYIKSKY